MSETVREWLGACEARAEAWDSAQATTRDVFTVMETDLPRAVAALRAVLALHYVKGIRTPGTHAYPEEWSSECAECGYTPEDDGDECPTVRAVAEVLG